MSSGSSAEIDPLTYEKWRGSALGRITEAIERKLIFDLTGNIAGLSVLDVGCGDGDLAVELSKRGAKVSGIDASPQMIDAARQHAARQGADVTFEVATAQALPFRREAFDAVVAVTVLCFVGDGGPVLREMARVLRPGGRLIIGELGKWSTWAAERRVRGWFGSPVWKQARFHTDPELRGIVHDAGFVIVDLRGAIYYPRFGLVARLLGPVDWCFGRLTTRGAAFLAVAATKVMKEGNGILIGEEV